MTTEKSNQENKLSRREFLEYIKGAGKRAGIITAVSGAALVAATFSADKTVQKNKSSSTDQVRAYADEIYHAASRTETAAGAGTLAALALTWGASDVTGSVATRSIPRRKIIAGIATMVAGNSIDFISTYEFANETGDPRWKEYGLDAHLMETNPVLPNAPTKRQVLACAAWNIPLTAILVTAIPEVGFGYLGASPFIAASNMKNRRIMQRCLELGDKVKELINEKTPPENIRAYLSSYSVKAK